MCDMSSTSDDVYWDDFNITGYVSPSSEQELWFSNNLWNVNVTVPSGLNGYQDLFADVTNGTAGAGATSTESLAIHYD